MLPIKHICIFQCCIDLSVGDCCRQAMSFSPKHMAAGRSKFTTKMTGGPWYAILDMMTYVICVSDRMCICLCNYLYICIYTRVTGIYGAYTEQIVCIRRFAFHAPLTVAGWHCGSQRVRHFWCGIWGEEWARSPFGVWNADVTLGTHKALMVQSPQLCWAKFRLGGFPLPMEEWAPHWHQTLEKRVLSSVGRAGARETPETWGC